MAKVLDCKEMGPACGYVACASTDKEVIQDLGEHIRKVHAMKGFSRNFYQKAYASLQEGDCEPEENREENLCELCEGVCTC